MHVEVKRCNQLSFFFFFLRSFQKNVVPRISYKYKYIMRSLLFLILQKYGLHISENNICILFSLRYTALLRFLNVRMELL